MEPDVKASPATRTRRSARAENTRKRILAAATELFVENGYSPTTMESIANRADVAVETVYSRFRNKANLLDAILQPAIIGSADGRLFDREEIALIRGCSDQGTQVRMLARFSRGILERTHTAHQILRAAATADPNAAELQRRDSRGRCEGQRAYIDMLLANGPLRDGLRPADAAETYSVLASPTTYAFLVHERHWTPEQFEEWLGDVLTRLLMP